MADWSIGWGCGGASPSSPPIAALAILLVARTPALAARLLPR